MKSRDDLSERLHELCDHVYFQPGTNTTIVYPCIVYELNDVDVTRADNKPYIKYDVYTITHVYKSPSANIRDVLMDAFDFISYNRQFKNDGLYHDVFTLYF